MLLIGVKKKAMPGSHLVILKKPYLDSILSGRKRLELRLHKSKRPPFGRVSAGDKLFLKQSSGPVLAAAKAEKVKFFENLCRYKIEQIRQNYNSLILGDDQYWQNKSDCQFGTVIWLNDVQRIKPVFISKKDWRAWVVLSEKENFGLPM